MLLTARNLSKSYGSRLLFSGITLGLEENDRVGLIGANGSGKSTLLKLFANVDSPDDGELIAKRNLRVGYVAQEDAFDPHLTCEQIITDAIDRHVDEHDRQVRAAILLDRAGFASRMDAAAGELSGGWRKRLSLVRAMATEPELLLIDEPTNHLDIDGIEWLEKNRRRGELRHADRHPRPPVFGNRGQSHHRAEPGLSGRLSGPSRAVFRVS